MARRRSSSRRCALPDAAFRILRSRRNFLIEPTLFYRIFSNVTFCIANRPRKPQICLVCRFNIHIVNSPIQRFLLSHSLI